MFQKKYQATWSQMDFLCPLNQKLLLLDLDNLRILTLGTQKWSGMKTVLFFTLLYSIYK